MSRLNNSLSQAVAGKLPRRAAIGLAFVLAVAAAALLLQPVDLVRTVHSESSASDRSMHPAFYFADMIEKAAPAVVAIQVQGTAPAESPLDFFQQEEFREFFRQWEDRFPHFYRNQPDDRPRHGIGSGVIIDSSGYAVTNAHVVKDADKITIMTSDQETYSATLVGIDDLTDLAVIQIESDGKASFPHARFGDSDKVRVGDFAIALGNPFGFSHSASLGIVSAKGRDQLLGGSNVPMIQTDAAVNRGNSGGPLLNADGEIIGINTLIVSPSSVSAGVGFAIPSSWVSKVVDELIVKGYVQRGWLGVGIQNVTAGIAEALELESSEGALVTTISQNSPASKAGIHVADVILSVDGSPVRDAKGLAEIVRGAEPGSETKLKVWRDGKTIQLFATLDRLGDEYPVPASFNSETEEEPQPRIGVQLAPLDENTRAQFGIGEDSHGVVIVEVEPDAPAQEAGLRSGDLIISVDRNRTDSPAQVAKSIREAAKKREKVLLLIERDGNKRFIAVGLS